MIELCHITKIYGQKPHTYVALRNVSLKIKRGEFVAIMGPSGSGKSTLMNIMGALDRQTSGRYLLNGQDISKLTDNALADFRNQQVGFVFQQFNLLKQTTVYDNVALPALYGKVKNLPARVRVVLKLVGLEQKAKRKPSELSGGEVQRVAIARALLMQPAIIMADEPTGNLDSKTAFGIMENFQKIHAQGDTIILVTHEDYIARYAERLIRLSDGQIKYDNAISKK